MADLLNLNQVEKLKGAEKNQELRKACADFESVLLNYMFQSMKNTVGNGGIFGESFQRDMYESLYLEKISTIIAEERDMGLGDALYRELAARMKNGGGDNIESAAEVSEKDA
jgi:flagellar protein FlgJ